MFSALIIDADQDAARHIESALRPYGFDFTSTQDAPEAMSMARSATPDIIFLRVELPNVSGFSVCNKLRRSDETKYIPLVMYASGVSDDVFNQHRNLKTHADEYLKLPFPDTSLLSAVRGLIPLPEDPGDASPVSLGPESAEHEAPDDNEDEDPLAELDLDDLEPELELESPPARRPPARVQSELAQETDAAFDALVDGDDDLAAFAPAVATPSEPELELDAFEPDSIVSEPEPDLAAFAPAPANDVPHDLALEPRDAAPKSVGLLELDLEPEPNTYTVMSSEPEVYEAKTTAEDDTGRAGGGAEFRAQREVIALKAQLNAKNRELLSLREELESRERALLDAKHKNRELLQQHSDLEEKLLRSEEQTINANERAEAAHLDKATALKREEGLKIRFDAAQKKIKDLEEQIGRTQDAEARTRDELESTRGELEAARAETAEARAEARAQADAAAREAAFSNGRIAALEAEVADVRAEGQTAIKILTEEHQAEAEFNDRRFRTELESAKAAEASAWGAAEDLRNQLTEAETAAQSERERLAAQLAELEGERTRLQKSFADAQHRNAQTQTQLERVNGELDDTRRALDGARTDLDTRRAIERRAQQALAVALRVLDGQQVT